MYIADIIDYKVATIFLKLKVRTKVSVCFASEWIFPFFYNFFSVKNLKDRDSL
jgi:hypothetical protein